MSDKANIPLVRIKDGGAQMRVEMRPETVNEYADDMLNGAVFPPVVLYHDGDAFWLADGFHRVEAARKIDRETIDAEVHEGYSGEMARLLNDEIDNWLDPGLPDRVNIVRGDIDIRFSKTENVIEERHAEAIVGIEERFQTIVDQYQDWTEQASGIWEKVKVELEEHRPDLSDVEVPRSEARGETDRFVLFDSRRDFFTQLDHYHMWRDGDE